MSEPKRRKRPFNRPRRKGQRSTAHGEHRPVLLAEVLTVLNPQPGQVVIDCTLGFAGHSVELLRRVGAAGTLVAIDLDPDNIPRAEPKLAEVGFPFKLHHGNFAGVPTFLAMEGIAGVDGLLADLGMSSMQVDDRERGFSFMRDGPLDMRMDRSRGKTAAVLLNTLPEEELAAAFRDLGDEPAAAAIAAAIVAQRAVQPIERTGELRELIDRAAPVDVVRGPGRPAARKQRLLPTTRVFQSLRILVNRELANLRQLLRVLPDLLNPGGTAAFISFHSGEDRIIKAAFRDGLRTGIYEAASDDPIRPSEQEKLDNPRARSAKLRWARKPAAS
ncbi:16S rRNA (cytosine(1402)-N(4))-methyltransferase RsmH [Fimbriiglobus ruber]|uniref:Ribosomal RNA small subunit methyltransferase H n=1 Tax=Fimbriiglobus ruber TaxID=1908690 RepID=A0A225DSL5_9BACT|nr:16S rRNA (cytosine(1402)-N(4))-methyltransferase RsmH [Fimbriiglobus ruber]OWK44422.1 rRNA small subunit methyltransferase H [Fimbriiglobus ruber]